MTHSSILKNTLPGLVDEQRKPISLGRKIATGGEGSVFEIEGRPDTLAKVYLPTRQTSAQARADKLCAMIALTPLRGDGRFAWPQELLRNANGQTIGFTMRRGTGVSLVALSALALREKRLPGWDQRHVARVVWEIAVGCALLQKHGVLIGDISLTNFLVEPGTCRVTFIDVDSYQIVAGGKTFPCTVGTPDFQPPELQAGNGRPVNIGPAQVHFSAAILFFQMLTAGGHPYNVKRGGTPVENIQAGRHFLGPKGVASGGTTDAIYARYRSLSPYLMHLFKMTFIQGHADPTARADFYEWAKAATAFAQKLEGN